MFFRGARHGLKATGKLARIAQQEAMLLTESRFNGYSHAKRLKDKVVEEMNLNSDSEVVDTKKKKKKRKRCNSDEKQEKIYNKDCIMAESNQLPLPENVEMTQDEDIASVIKEVSIKKKLKKTKRKNVFDNDVILEEDENIVKPKKKKKEKYAEITEDGIKLEGPTENNDTKASKKKKKKQIDS